MVLSIKIRDTSDFVEIFRMGAQLESNPFVVE